MVLSEFFAQVIAQLRMVFCGAPEKQRSRRPGWSYPEIYAIG
jgi:hypothetical protein